MLRRRIALSFDLNLIPFYSVKVNLLDFNDSNDSIIFSIDSVLSRCTCINSNDSSLFSVMVDLIAQARRQLNWNGGGGGMDSQYKLLSELLSNQAAFITSPKTSLAKHWGALPPAPLPPSVYGPVADKVLLNVENNLSGSAVITSNVVRTYSNIRTLGKIFCQPRPLEQILPATPFGAKMALPNAPR